MSNIYTAYKYYQKLGNIRRSNYTIKRCKNNTTYKLSKNQKEQVDNFFSNYAKHDYVFHEFYTEKTGQFYPNYIPDDLYYTKIDTFYNDWLAASILDNKCMYDVLFPESIVKQPVLLFKRMNGMYFDTDGKALTHEDVANIIENSNAIFMKQAEDSSGGAGVHYIEKEIFANYQKLANEWSRDFVVQVPLIQCHELNRLNDSSVNTIRVLSLLNKDGVVKVYSAILRMGINGAKVDNSCSGGISCGINSDGSLKSVAYTEKGEKFFEHPTSGIKFDTVIIPNYSKVIDTVMKLHPLVPHFRLVSWDIAVDKDKNPVLIEANLKYGELGFHQLKNGPLFGDDTEKILNEVFENR